MSAPMKLPPNSRPRVQRGMALITAMLLLIVVTIMALSMFRSYGTQERIAGNTRDKQRAINAAISAQQFAETWLASGQATAKVVCVPPLISSNIGQVCSNLPNLNTLPWTTGVVYTQFTSNPINTFINNVNSTTPTAGSYYAAPVFYITDLGTYAGDATKEVYQIDALGYGATANTVAVVESTFVIGAGGPTQL
jgi:type IV pilus assembly protein PilX